MANLKTLLKGKIPKEKLNYVPSSFEVVGSIAIFNDIHKEIKKYEKKIAQLLIDNHKNIETVVKKTGKYSGRLRTPKLSIIVGKRTKVTTHKENNIFLKLDIEKCYFSTRTATERLRIAKLTKKDESVLVLFSGIAPFPCVISKNAKAKEIFGIELNKIAHKYAKENIKLNKLKNITLFQGDVNKVLPKIKKKFDRIIMPLPKSSEDYLDVTLKKLKPKGTIHLYVFSQEKDIKYLKKKYKHKFKKVKATKCGMYSPHVFRVCLDLQN